MLAEAYDASRSYSYLRAPCALSSLEEAEQLVQAVAPVCPTL